MKVSVLIAIQPSSPALADALAGLAAQTHDDWELIVGEAGTSAETDAALREFTAGQNRTRHERLAAEALVGDVRNRLLELATGDAIAFLEPQDQWLPRHLASAVQSLAAGADVAVANVRIYDPKTDRPVSELAMPATLGSATVRTLFARDAISSPSCVVAQRAAVLATGQFDVQLRTAECRDFFLRCALGGARFVVTQKATCRCGRLRMTPGERALLTAEHAVLFYEKHRDLSAVPAALRRRLLAGALVAHGRLLRPIDPSRAARCFMRAWSLQPVHVQTLGQYALTEWRESKTDHPHDVS